jgi:C1A family cysteine protease
VSLGWIPDIPDGRDYDLSHPKVRAALEAIEENRNGQLLSLGASRALPTSADLRQGMSPIEDQGQLGSCTANAAVGAVEYLYLKGCHELLDLSRLFLYKATRKLLGWQGDSGAYIRSTLKALATFGVPPESYWPYDTTGFDVEPDAFVYQMASNFKALTYARLDENGSDGAATLERVKKALADGFPVAFGFPVYNSIQMDGQIPYPTANDTLLGGHAVLAVGYDDAAGILLIRNSWGPDWGKAGYGFMPYQYVTDQLAADFWTLFSESWIEDGRFEERARAAGRAAAATGARPLGTVSHDGGRAGRDSARRTGASRVRIAAGADGSRKAKKSKGAASTAKA